MGIIVIMKFSTLSIYTYQKASKFYKPSFWFNKILYPSKPPGEVTTSSMIYTAKFYWPIGVSELNSALPVSTYRRNIALRSNFSASVCCPMSFRILAKLFIAWSYSGFNLKQQ